MNQKNIVATRIFSLIGLLAGLLLFIYGIFCMSGGLEPTYYNYYGGRWTGTMSSGNSDLTNAMISANLQLIEILDLLKTAIHYFFVAMGVCIFATGIVLIAVFGNKLVSTFRFNKLTFRQRSIPQQQWQQNSHMQNQPPYYPETPYQGQQSFSNQENNQQFDSNNHSDNI